MLTKIINLVLLTFLPFLELRYSIPIGILEGTVNLPFGYSITAYAMPWWIVFVTCVIANIIIAVILYFIIDFIVKLLCKIKFINRLWRWKVQRTQKKIQPLIEKYGELGLAIFIGIPLPGSGVYTGCIAAYVLGMKFKHYLIASIIGVLIAAIIVTLLSVGVNGYF